MASVAIEWQQTREKLLQQPLLYQVTEISCWVTSMLNGIQFFRPGEKVSPLAYRLLHSLLQDNGVFYYERRDLESLEAIIAVTSQFDRSIHISTTVVLHRLRHC